MSVFETTIPVGHIDAMPVTVHYTKHAAACGFADFIEIDYVSYDSEAGSMLLNLTSPDESMLREQIAKYLMKGS